MESNQVNIWFISLVIAVTLLSSCYLLRYDKSYNYASLDIIEKSDSIIISLTALENIYYLQPNSNDSKYLLMADLNSGVLFQSNREEFYKKLLEGMTTFSTCEFRNENRNLDLCLTYLEKNNTATLYQINIDSLFRKTGYKRSELDSTVIDVSHEFYLLGNSMYGDFAKRHLYYISKKLVLNNNNE